jgi:hypothetical protein
MGKRRNLKVGKDSVVYGNVNGEIGDRSVVVGPTDDRGNTILNKGPLAIGHGAYAGPDSIAIGAGAGAGAGALQAYREIGNIVQNSGDMVLIQNFAELNAAIECKERDKPRIRQLWDIISSASTISGFIDLVARASVFVDKIIKL